MRQLHAKWVAAGGPGAHLARGTAMTTTTVSPTDADAALFNDLDVRWIGNFTFSVPGVGAVWSTPYGSSNEPASPLYSAFSAAQADGFRAAVGLWDDLIASSITEVADAPNAGLRIAFTDAAGFFGDPGLVAYAYNPFQNIGDDDIAGDIWVDARFTGSSFAQGSTMFQTMLHELGHALGMKHSFAPPEMPAGFENTAYTVMSYTSPDYAVRWQDDGGTAFSSSTDVIDYTPMVLDILAIQNHYGADLTTRTGNDVYSFADVDGRRAIYDAGGVDTLDVSNFARGSHVDLRPGAYSDINYNPVAAQIEALVAQFGEDDRAYITSTMTDPSSGAYEWTKNVGIAFSTIIENAIGGEAGDEIIGNDVANDLYGRGGADTLIGGLGSDDLFGGLGADRLEGGDGFDYARYSDANYGAMVISLSNPSENTGAAAGDTYSSVEGVIGGAGNDTIKGDGNVNTLSGMGGVDSMVGFGGGDTYIVDNTADVVIEAAGGGADTVMTTAVYSLAAGQEIERLMASNATGTVSINLTGNEFKNALLGNAGANSLNGRGGADVMTGYAGDDRYFVDDAGDRVVEAKDGGADAVFANVNYTLEGGQAVETLATFSVTGTTPINLMGNEFANALIGNAGANSLNGRAGADTMTGYGGDDRYFVDSASDVVVESGGSAGGTDTVYASVSYRLGAGQQIETLATFSATATTAQNLYGNELANAVMGNNGVNTMDGSRGADVLTGYAGRDTFWFSTALGAGNIDRITDFYAPDDTIQLSRAAFAGLSAGPLGGGAFKQVTATSGVIDGDDRIIYNQTTGALFFDADGSGTGAGQIQFATLDNKATVGAADVVIV